METVGGDFSRELSALKGRRILGVNPPVYDFSWFDLWAKPLGLLFLLQFLRERGNEVHLVDCLDEGRTTPLSFGRWKVSRVAVEKPAPLKNIPRRYYRFGLEAAAFRQRLSSCPPPDVILVTSGMTYWYPGVFEAVETLHEIFPRVPVLLGGIYARLCSEHALRSGANFVQTEFPDDFLHVVTTPALDLYSRPGYGVLLTSRGCPLQCEYCASHRLYPDFVQRPPEDVFADLRAQMSLYPLSNMAFYDDALLVGKERHFYPICEYIRENFPDLNLHTPNGLHVAQLNDECCRILFDTGFQTIRLSLEGTDSFTVGLSSNKTRPSQYMEAVESLRKAGYTPDRIETYVLAGLPGQKTEDVRASIEFVRKLGGRVKLAEFSPVPGTPIFEKVLALTPQIADEPLLHNNTIYAP
ncbi:MAG: radical SAM protein, partial [Synergistaceae bacterium]|nr:radical SAM protein [Synergistaceae bacterium]